MYYSVRIFNNGIGCYLVCSSWAFIDNVVGYRQKQWNERQLGHKWVRVQGLCGK